MLRYKLLGKSGLRVSEICLGAMSFGEDWGWGSSKDESRKVFDTFVQHGGNFIDTANVYTSGTSERFVGEFIAAERDRFVLATKYTISMRKDDPNGSGNHRKNLLQSVNDSLKRLNTPYIDLLWLHAWDYMTPVEEVMRGLDDVVASGKVNYIGISDTPAWIVSQANTLAELRGWHRLIGLQIEYSLIERTPERELTPMARAFDMAVTAWGPLAGGVLSGKYSKDGTANDGSKRKPTGERLSDRSFAIAREVEAVAKVLGCKPTQVALNWLRKQAGIVIPIVGARSAQQLEDNLNCVNFELPPEHFKRLSDVSQIALGFPHDFLTREEVRQIVFGKTFGLIDNHHKL